MSPSCIACVASGRTCVLCSVREGSLESVLPVEGCVDCARLKIACVRHRPTLYRGDSAPGIERVWGRP